MNNFDIGIDLGTTEVVIYSGHRGVLLREPSVVAFDENTGKVRAVGQEAFLMMGKAPAHIRVVKPLSDGVISDYEMAQEMIKYFVTKVCQYGIVRPQVAVCIPAKITDVESRAVVDTAVSAGARKVYLIEEPMAAAIGLGIDVVQPMGNLVVDIGGGTTDIAVITLGGISMKTSIKVAGDHFDEAIVKAVRKNFNLIIGSRSAEQLKKEVGSVFLTEDRETEVKGRNALNGLPQKVTVKSSDLYEPLLELAEEMVASIREVLEKTPPELVGDIYTNGIYLTGGTSQLDGLPALLTERTGIAINLCETPTECVAIGTGKSFDYLDKLYDGITDYSSRKY